ncbi:MAG: hypothetical protein FJ148_05795 [Deltaproteobacteria bacterium]|nr:hypothetical protein [Deltaproteobacteria bacterium]
MKVMRERRFLFALAMVSAIVTGSAGTSSAIFPNDGFSYTQPGAELIMPFDSTEGKATFLLVSNIHGTSPAGGAQITTHWTFWSETCDELANYSICLTLNDTVVVDPTNARALNAANLAGGPLIDLTGKRGIVTVTAYRTNTACGDFRQTGQVLADDAIVGTFTIADSEVGYAFGNDAFGLGLNGAGTAVVLPPSAEVDSFNIEVFDPTSVESSVVVLSHLREFSSGQVEPNPTPLRFSTTFIDTNEIPTSLPEQNANCVRFAQISSDAETTGLIPPTVDVTTSGIIRLHPISSLGPNDYLYSIVGQAVGPFGASGSAKVKLGDPSASRAFIDAPASLFD